MAIEFNIEIISPEKLIYSGKAISLTCPAWQGYLGILADHAPLAAKLKSGTITIKEPSGRDISFPLKGAGFLEVLNNTVTLLLGSADQLTVG